MKINYIFGFIAFLFSSLTSASVVITGTRVIYTSDQREKTVQLINNDNFPNVIQAWVDIDDYESPPESANAPFFVTPPVFRMEAGSGQNLRLVFTGGDTLPHDRESIFHLNVLQIPPRSSSQSGQNQMLLMLRNRLKLFYRPTTIPGSPEQLIDKLEFKLRQNGDYWSIEVENPSGYYASFGNAILDVSGKQVALKPVMVSPRSKERWIPTNFNALPDGTVKLRAQLINDYGARIEIIRTLDR